MSIEKAHESITYDVEYKDKHYSVTFATDINIGYTDESIIDDDGLEVDVKLAEEILEYVHETIHKQEE